MKGLLVEDKLTMQGKNHKLSPRIRRIISTNKISKPKNVEILLAEIMIESIFISAIRIETLDISERWQAYERSNQNSEYIQISINDLGEVRFGNINVLPGNYSKIRIILPPPVCENAPPHNPGCYIQLKNGITEPLFIPNGEETGIVLKGNLQISHEGLIHLEKFQKISNMILHSQLLNSFILKPIIQINNVK